MWKRNTLRRVFLCPSHDVIGSMPTDHQVTEWCAYFRFSRDKIVCSANLKETLFVETFVFPQLFSEYYILQYKLFLKYLCAFFKDPF